MTSNSNMEATVETRPLTVSQPSLPPTDNACWTCHHATLHQGNLGPGVAMARVRVMQGVTSSPVIHCSLPPPVPWPGLVMSVHELTPDTLTTVHNSHVHRP